MRICTPFMSTRSSMSITIISLFLSALFYRFLSWSWHGVLRHSQCTSFAPTSLAFLPRCHFNAACIHYPSCLHLFPFLYVYARQLNLSFCIRCRPFILPTHPPLSPDSTILLYRP